MPGQLSVDRLSDISRTLASEPDEQSTIARAVEQGALILNCSMVDVLGLRPYGAPIVVASTNPARSNELIQAGRSAADNPALLCCPVSCSSIVTHPWNESRDGDYAERMPAVTQPPLMPSSTSPTVRGSRYVLRFLSADAANWAGPELRLALAFADFAALAIDRSALRSRAHDLALGLESNRLIGTAVGILMAERRTTYDHAFQLLRACSQETNRKLRQVADEVVLTGELPRRTDRGAA